MPTLLAHGLRVLGRGPFDLRVSGGACAGIRGASGSGKSLFLRALADLVPHEGEVRLGAEVAESVPAPEWRRRVALLPPDPQWWAPTVGGHFIEPGNHASLLDELGFGGDVLAWDPGRLSSGERQRLALARLLSRAPEALLLDEPTANLDGDNAAAVERIVVRYCRAHDAPAVWVGHDLAQLGRVAAERFRLAPSGLEPDDGGPQP